MTKKEGVPSKAEVKEVLGKKSTKGKTKKPTTSKKKRLTAREREELLIENFAGLQKVMTNLSIKFESLASQISTLLQVFELSAKSLVKGGGGEGEGDKDLLNKIDSLLNQNKTLAKGLVLIEDKLRARQGIPSMPPQVTILPSLIGIGI